MTIKQKGEAAADGVRGSPSLALAMQDAPRAPASPDPARPSVRPLGWTHIKSEPYIKD
jgi:hypothetical protein